MRNHWQGNLKKLLAPSECVVTTVRAAVGLLWGLLLLAQIQVAQANDFETTVAPIFEEHCIRCHNPGNTKGDFSLSTFSDLAANEYVVGGEPDASYLIELVAGVDGQPPEMPQNAAPLSKEEVDVLRRWIREGAVWPADKEIREKPKADSAWWSYQPLKSLAEEGPEMTSVTQANDPKVLKNAAIIDNFVAEKLQTNGEKINPEADRRTLIRRLTYDLTGLPPTPAEVADFVSDEKPGAFAKLVDRLLASPRYGERWGRHWLDVVRFGESNGFERNVIINDLWPFRDYVIESINADKPFSQLIKEHIAGDVLGDGKPSEIIGTAFLVAGPYDDVGNQDAAQAAQIRANTLDEIINATGEAFLGMTLGCARCHDHKFDPITQEDYYGLYATFAGVKHGRAPLATPKQIQERAAKVMPLEAKQAELNKALEGLTSQVLARANEHKTKHQAGWTRPQVDRTNTVEEFEPVIAKYVRFTCDANDLNFLSKQFRIDEFEVWTADGKSKNVALQANGGKATGKARKIQDFPNAYGPQHVNDGVTGARYISAGGPLTIELTTPVSINRIVFSSARGESTPDQTKFSFVAEYHIDVSVDGQSWVEVASGRDRKPREVALPGFRAPANAKAIKSHLDFRMLDMEISQEEKQRRKELQRDLSETRKQLSQIPTHQQAWIGTRSEQAAKGPFTTFVGGDPQRKGSPVLPSSLSVLAEQCAFELSDAEKEATRRKTLAEWIVHPNNPLTLRVLANRIWHYHFGTGIVDTPSDFGFMGGKPTHPELLDFLAQQLKANDYRIKNLHRMIVMTATYRQASDFRDPAAVDDADARLLWRFPPRRLSSEEIRDTILMISGKLDLKMGGPGFRLYEFQQDNVCTYVPLDVHGPETYRRAVYHQNARASVVDFMTEFDQPDCAFSTPRRAQTTTPLQALTMLNHSFTADMSAALAERVTSEAGKQLDQQIIRLYQLCYARKPNQEELADCTGLVNQYGLKALCRVLLNTSELIYVQ